MKAILWGYKFKDMKESWRLQMIWLVNATKNHDITVKRHPNFKCQGLEYLSLYNPESDPATDICIYNHADISHLTGDILPARLNLFFKPTVPDEFHTTLDNIGYGPYSSLTFNKPDFENINQESVNLFYNTKVAKWIKNKNTKWGKYFKNANQEISYKNYYLVLGQCAGDEVVKRHDFGTYCHKLEAIVKELSRVTDKKIVVKLHPYMDGTNASNNNFSKSIANRLIKLSKQVTVYIGKSNIHNFIKNAYCVVLANSGAGFEVMMHDKPIIAWGYPEYHWVCYDLRFLADLKRATETINKWFDPCKQRKFLYWYLEKYCFYNQETANNRIDTIMKELL